MTFYKNQTFSQTKVILRWHFFPNFHHKNCIFFFNLVFSPKGNQSRWMCFMLLFTPLQCSNVVFFLSDVSMTSPRDIGYLSSVVFCKLEIPRLLSLVHLVQTRVGNADKKKKMWLQAVELKHAFQHTCLGYSVSGLTEVFRNCELLFEYWRMQRAPSLTCASPILIMLSFLINNEWYWYMWRHWSCLWFIIIRKETGQY